MKNFTYKAVIKYFLCLACFTVANNITSGVPFSIAFLPALMSSGFLPLPTLIIFGAVSLLSYPFIQATLLCSIGAIFALIFAIYKANKKQVKGELIIYFAIALLPYLLSNHFSANLQQKLIYSAIIYAFSLIFSTATEVILVNKFQKKCAKHERIALYVFTVIFSLGLISITGVNLYRAIALSAMLFLCKLFKGAKAFVPAFLLPIAIALYTNGLSVLAIFQIYCASILLFIDYSPLLSALALSLTQFAIFYLSGEIFAFNLNDYFLTLLPTILFLFTPQKLVDKLKEMLYKFNEPELLRNIINVERGVLSAKLNELSAVFYEMENALNGFDELFLSGDGVIHKIAEECVLNVCSVCPFFADCQRKGYPSSDDLYKLISIGISKGKISLIDLSRDFSSYCYSVNGMIYEINRLIFLHLEKAEKNEQIVKFKTLAALQSSAVAQTLSQFSYDLASQIHFNNKKEKIAVNALHERGIVCLQIIHTGDYLHLLFKDEGVVLSEVSKILSSAFNQSICRKDKKIVKDGMIAIFEKAPRLDACFGVACKCKEGGSVCGDCHSLTKIDEGKFLVSLCDGMGSGFKAYKNSQTAISLFECFYKSGLPRESCLELANKILSACAEESFATLDCAIFDLHSGICDSIKIGASCGFLISDNQVKILENDCLPLGILDEIKPTIHTMQLKSGDILLLLSDGITDAFFSSTDAVDFLLAQTTKNPQTLASNLLEEAVRCYGGEAKDDMTAVCVKIYAP